MSASKTFQSVQFCAVRATRLNCDGTAATGAVAAYVSCAPITLTPTPDILAPENKEQVNGCDCLCFTYRTAPKLRGFNLKLEMCSWEIPLIELLTGASLIQTDAGSTDSEIFGFNVGTETACDTQQCGVALEGWAKAWQGDGQKAPPYSFVRYLFPKTVWTWEPFTIGNDLSKPSFTGVGFANVAFQDPFDDWPAAGVVDTAGPMSVWQESAQATCTPEADDYTTVPGGS